MATSSFLDSCTFLTDAQREALRAEDLDTPAAYKRLTIADLKAEPFKLTAGKASQLLDAANVPHGGAALPSRVNLKLAEPMERSERIDRALAAVHANPARASMLTDLDIVYVVLQADDKLDVAQTKAMLAHCAAGATVGMTWKGQRIVEAARLSTPAIWCSPPTGRPLQAGQDDKTDVPWGELGIDGLRLASFGYREGMFGGLADEGVFTRIRDNAALREKIADRMKAVGVKPEDMDNMVVYQPQRLGRRGVEPFIASPQLRSPALAGSLVGNVANLFTSMLGDGEIRGLVREHGGDSVAHNLPGGGTSPATLAFEAASTMQRYGLLNRGLRDRLVRLRPRRVDEIDAVFSAAGLV